MNKEFGDNLNRQNLLYIFKPFKLSLQKNNKKYTDESNSAIFGTEQKSSIGGAR
jgi:hypothetical protein